MSLTNLYQAFELDADALDNMGRSGGLKDARIGFSSARKKF